jgi:hypothetical protein
MDGATDEFKRLYLAGTPTKEEERTSALATCIKGQKKEKRDRRSGASARA